MEGALLLSAVAAAVSLRRWGAERPPGAGGAAGDSDSDSSGDEGLGYSDGWRVAESPPLMPKPVSSNARAPAVGCLADMLAESAAAVRPETRRELRRMGMPPPPAGGRRRAGAGGRFDRPPRLGGARQGPFSDRHVASWLPPPQPTASIAPEPPGLIEPLFLGGIATELAPLQPAPMEASAEGKRQTASEGTSTPECWEVPASPSAGRLQLPLQVAPSRPRVADRASVMPLHEEADLCTRWGVSSPEFVESHENWKI
mmetsp:Transcript_112957/g.324658  ORF Transcript_112957/g.324658 Transcript_112957/m.324658 type:complete len:257 (+) Transcript_112957:2-772(+)